ncbi:MAG: DUF2637 domain-containing protein, partial [Candidatus Limnocylindria bacterium]
GIAAVISYKHMYHLVLRYGETSWTAALLPVSVDGMIVVASMSLLVDSRQGRRSGLLPWTLLVLGSAASLAANVAVAEPSVVGRLIAAWASCALIGAYELLMRQIRRTAVMKTGRDNAVPGVTLDAAHRTPEAAHRISAATHRGSEDSHKGPRLAPAPSEESLRRPTARRKTSEKSHSGRAFDLIRSAGSSQERGAADGAAVQRSPSSRAEGTGDVDIQRRAWRWAVANRTPEGDLPPGKAIGSRFGRSERWGRLVKQAGRTGRLDTVAS